MEALVSGLLRSSQSDGGDHQQQKVLGFVSEGTGSPVFLRGFYHEQSTARVKEGINWQRA